MLSVGRRSQAAGPAGSAAPVVQPSTTSGGAAGNVGIATAVAWPHAAASKHQRALTRPRADSHGGSLVSEGACSNRSTGDRELHKKSPIGRNKPPRVVPVSACESSANGVFL